MVELVLTTQCKSSLRTMTESLLNLSFPLWGVMVPLAVLGIIAVYISCQQLSQHQFAAQVIYYAPILTTFSLVCLVLKRIFGRDEISIDKDGIKLPRFTGNRMSLKRYIAWNSIDLITTTTSNSRGKEISNLLLVQRNGTKTHLTSEYLPTSFLEQFILASRMWAPSACDHSLEELHRRLRELSTQARQASYTELWEEELGRRFCPTSYIPLEVGQVIRRNTLKIVSHLSSGGLSALYLCQLNAKELVVLKEATTPDSGTEDIREKAREMFTREARLLMSIDHPNIVRVVDTFLEADRNYLLMEHVNGIDLRQMVAQNGPQKEADVLDWATQIALGLKYLHEREQPIIHRDLTPDNLVLRNDGKVIIVDFGAANELIGTATGTFVGKHAFIAPEQLRGKATVQSDIYAFGCTLHYLLTGAEPLALSQSNPRSIAQEISEELAELVESCTQFEASARYQSVAQMLPVLRRLSAQSLVV
jgi:tRNA A-37 threonylcarbamoyl transferase component Bud32